MGTIKIYVKKSGEKTFNAEVRKGATKGKSPILRASFRTMTEAKQWVQDTESAKRDGRHTSGAATRRRTVNDLIDHFITHELSKDQKYLKKKISLLDRWKKELGRMSLVNITPPDLSLVRNKLLVEPTLQGKKRSPSTANRYLAAFSRVLSYGVKELGWLKENPMQKIGKMKESQGRDRFLSREEIDRLLAACQESKNQNLYPIVSIAIMTGMRYGEIVNLKWGDINFDSRFLTLHLTKNGSRRVIPLTDDLIGVLKTG
jgi:integrase